ncbi:protein MKS1-like [Hordeum vulgare]|uniref:Predicted protein n=1 Tax=Hordeum vulgare subsp. vulgare TaxID=112509 RepID=F2DMI4_HORVV|nr:protein MKS1-like [Hordeum vulgare subsp. vulgare]KAE8785655.1 protein MKS1-like [Hordeum vulgare]KAI4971456.1 hypothetical protein ZWY2020_002370 [Hordeum vulgare]BAJ96305.1 predicted protein [Hordeum vulgare subsp. vulgare]
MATTTSYDNADVRHRALGVHGASRKIGKPAQQQNRKPVIIYMVSPKVIHVEAHEFMSLVQRLTGPEVAGEDGRERASTSTSSPGAATDRAGRAAQPVRVKARALNRPGPAVSVSVTATRQQQQNVPPSWAGPSPSPTTGFLFHDLSPLRGGALKGEAPMVSPWLHQASDHFLSPGGASALGSPSGFLDIFGPLSSQQQ